MAAIQKKSYECVDFAKLLYINVGASSFKQTCYKGIIGSNDTISTVDEYSAILHFTNPTTDSASQREKTANFRLFSFFSNNSTIVMVES